ncbi:hypothetical protein RRF57_013159 [Xylaria bambusicola]|uniref:Uncharacterized protein n=1 Tax=Xylaria bambusicola TaxID=326684 RepID=A0AAN7V6A9_9PEZI
MNNSTQPNEPTGVVAPSWVYLPGGCVLKLDEVGLPFAPKIFHTFKGMCFCHNEHEILIKYLIMWQHKYSEELGLGKVAATAMVFRLVDIWKLQVPRWLESNVQRWKDVLEDEPVKCR